MTDLVKGHLVKRLRLVAHHLELHPADSGVVPSTVDVEALWQAADEIEALTEAMTTQDTAALVERLRFKVVQHVPITDTMAEAAIAIEALTAANAEMREALKGLLEAFSLGPLGAAAKYGPDVDVREIYGAAVDIALAALARKP